jgi:hypothetical protein
MSQSLINRLLSQRESWLDLEPGKRVKVRRPPELEAVDLRHGVTLEHVTKYVVGWEGITEADLLGATVGSDTVPAFSADVWTIVVTDRMEWFALVRNKIMELVVEHLTAKDAAAKN